MFQFPTGAIGLGLLGEKPLHSAPFSTTIVSYFGVFVKWGIGEHPGFKVRAQPANCGADQACKPSSVACARPGCRKPAIISLGRQLPVASSGLPEGHEASHPGRTDHWPVRHPLFDLAPDGVCLAEPVTRSAGGLLHHRCTLVQRPFSRRTTCFLLHCAVGSPRLGVTQHRALWSSDFPPVPPGDARLPGLLGHHHHCSTRELAGQTYSFVPFLALARHSPPHLRRRGASRE